LFFLFLIIFVSNAANQGVTVHFIDSKFEVQNMMLALRKVPSHAGKDVAKIFYEVLEEYSIVNSFGWITTDNASSNDTFIVELQRLLSCNGYELDISEKRVRCLNHIIHLVVEDFLSGVNNEELPTEEEGQVDKPVKKVCRRSKKRRKSDDNSPVFKIY